MATAYGIAATRVTTLADLTHTVRAALAGTEPCLIEIPQQPIPDAPSQAPHPHPAEEATP